MLATDNLSLIPLVEGAPYSDVETGRASVGNQYRVGAGGGVVIVNGHGASGFTLAQLNQGTTPYNNGLAQVTAQRSLTIAAGDTYNYVGEVIVHGESDEIAGNTSYGTQLQTWQSDWETDVNAITGGTGTVPFFVSQVSSRAMTQGGTNTAIQQLTASEVDRTEIRITQPKYQYTYVDQQHLTNASYRWMGEKDGEVVERVASGEDWQPLVPTGITAAGTIVKLAFNVPDPPCRWDTTNVMGAVDGRMGFEVYAPSQGSLTLDRVYIENATTCLVRLELSEQPQSDVRIRYAFSGGTNNQGGALNVDAPRGNLKDSDAAVYASGSDASNWAVHFDKAIDTITGPDGGDTFVAPQIGANESICSAHFGDDAGANITVPDIAGMEPGAAATVIGWVRLDSNGNVNILEQRGGTGYFSIRFLSGSLRFIGGSTSNTAITVDTIGENIGPGDWFAFAFVYEGGVGYRFRTYFEGVTTEHALTTAGSVPATITGMTTSWYIGSPNTVNQAIDGNIAYLGYWPGDAASTAEIDEVLAAPTDYSTAAIGEPALLFNFDSNDDLTTAGGVDNKGTLGASADGTGDNFVAANLEAAAPGNTATGACATP
ncbi:MAG: hypothetical protein ACRBI6_04525 [Acidimicrobiales bacterium]